jgi:hypothetical protein
MNTNKEEQNENNVPKLPLIKIIVIALFAPGNNSCRSAFIS